jgi:O-antigen ligase
MHGSKRIRELLPFLLFSAAFFTSTWDLIGRRDFGGFHFKIHQAIFFLAFLSALPGTDFRAVWNRLRASPLLGFPLGILALDGFYMAASPWSFFPLKSFLYGSWLYYNLITIWGTAILLSARTNSRQFATLAWIVGTFNGVVILVDELAYHFGFHGGLIGFNQDAVLHWGVSRPHAFASEPSYAGLFLCLSILLCTFAYLEARTWKRLALIFLALLASIYTTSRLGWTGLILGNLVLSLCFLKFARTLPWRYLALIVAGGSLATAIALATIPKHERDLLNEKLVSGLGRQGVGSDGSANARIEAHKFALIMARETHWRGTGLGASYKYWIQRPETEREKHEFTAADNGAEVVMSTWGELLAEGGFMAVLLYAVAAFFLVRALWKAWAVSRAPLALGALACALLFFGDLAFWVGNIARGDVWIWYALWSVIALEFTAPAAAIQSRR